MTTTCTNVQTRISTLQIWTREYVKSLPLHFKNTISHRETIRSCNCWNVHSEGRSQCTLQLMASLPHSPTLCSTFPRWSCVLLLYFAQRLTYLTCIEHEVAWHSLSCDTSANSRCLSTTELYLKSFWHFLLFYSLNFFLKLRLFEE